MFSSPKEESGHVLNVFAVYDKKAQAYFNPCYFHYKGEALRGFEDQVTNVQSPLSKHPEDFALYRLGLFNVQTGDLQSCSKPEFVAEALDFRPLKENV